MRNKAKILKHADLPSLNSDAEFIGWQKTSLGKPFPLFNITIAAHPSFESTVSDATLRKLGLRVPQRPYRIKSLRGER